MLTHLSMQNNICNIVIQNMGLSSGKVFTELLLPSDVSFRNIDIINEQKAFRMEQFNTLQQKSPWVSRKYCTRWGPRKLLLTAPAISITHLVFSIYYDYERLEACKKKTT